MVSGSRRSSARSLSGVHPSRDSSQSLTASAGRVSTGPCRSSRPGTGSRRRRCSARAGRASSGRSGSFHRDTRSRRRRCSARAGRASRSQSGSFHRNTRSRSCTRLDGARRPSSASGCRPRSRRESRAAHRTGVVSSRSPPRCDPRPAWKLTRAGRGARGTDRRARGAAKGSARSSGSAPDVPGRRAVRAPGFRATLATIPSPSPVPHATYPKSFWAPKATLGTRQWMDPSPRHFSRSSLDVPMVRF
jgi:hypothetical protein